KCSVPTGPYTLLTVFSHTRGCTWVPQPADPDLLREQIEEHSHCSKRHARHCLAAGTECEFCVEVGESGAWPKTLPKRRRDSIDVGEHKKKRLAREKREKAKGMVSSDLLIFSFIHWVFTHRRICLSRFLLAFTC